MKAKKDIEELKEESLRFESRSTYLEDLYHKSWISNSIFRGFYRVMLYFIVVGSLIQITVSLVFHIQPHSCF
jgi:hypothetical protein